MGPAGSDQDPDLTGSFSACLGVASLLWAFLVITGLDLALVMVSNPDPDPASLTYVPSLSSDLPYHHGLD